MTPFCMIHRDFPPDGCETVEGARSGHLILQIERFREFFPEYAALPVVGLLATLSVDDSVLRYAERNGSLVAAVGEEVMELKNRADFEPRRWT